MSMYPHELGEIPAETARIARAAWPQGTLAMRLRDVLGEVYQDEHFRALYPAIGQPAYAPWRLALVTILQYVEGLTDRQASRAARNCLDWKYALGLELTETGFDFSLLSAFRQRLLEQGAETLLLDRLLEAAQQRGWLKAGGKQRTDSTWVIARVRSLSNLECAGETLRAALNDLAERAPDWLVQQITPDWFERYSHRVEKYRFPLAEKQRTALAEHMGTDGLWLLETLKQQDCPEGLNQLASVEVLRTVWPQYYELAGGKAKWRAGPQATQEHAEVVHSPYDLDADIGRKRETSWLGYKVHVTESCEPANAEAEMEAIVPQLIVQVNTTRATINDMEMTALIQEQLAERGVLPKEHLVDTGYVTAQLLVSSQESHGITLLGPAMPNTHWQAKAGKGFEMKDFAIDWDKEEAICPAGERSASWKTVKQGVQIRFAGHICRTCPLRSHCTISPKGRVLHPQERRVTQALHQRRIEQETPAFQERYAMRAGIEATLSQAIRRLGLRYARYDGLAKTHLQQVLTAVALNVIRIDAALTHTPRGQTRHGHFARLALHPRWHQPPRTA